MKRKEESKNWKKERKKERPDHEIKSVKSSSSSWRAECMNSLDSLPHHPFRLTISLGRSSRLSHIIRLYRLSLLLGPLNGIQCLHSKSSNEKGIKEWIGEKGILKIRSGHLVQFECCSLKRKASRLWYGTIHLGSTCMFAFRSRVKSCLFSGKNFPQNSKTFLKGWFYVSMWHINVCGLFKVTTILKDEQWYYVTHSWGDKRVQYFSLEFKFDCEPICATVVRIGSLRCHSRARFQQKEQVVKYFQDKVTETRQKIHKI